jgi:2-polyprenyl-3-methyl-5-hydroxy-6-metoxy-1,4-benzoquinol methylase
MDRFLPHRDETANLIQQQAEILHTRLSGIKVDDLGLPFACLDYFKKSHSTRLFFSIETSAHILYNSFTLTNKPVSELTVMDYGAGVGTLFLLAKMVGCKKVVYNDHLPEWKESAELIAAAIGVPIDKYIVGDIDQCVHELSEDRILCDIITSRNVLEHIYKPWIFFDTVNKHQPQAIIYSSTTANISNPASVLKHRRWHAKWEKPFRKERFDWLKNEFTDLTEAELQLISAKTRGLAFPDMREYVRDFKATKRLPRTGVIGTNTCDPKSGVWAENLVPFKFFREWINESRYTVIITPGFWDTHYRNSLMNLAAKALNSLIKSIGKSATVMAPFIYIVAVPKFASNEQRAS